MKIIDIIQVKDFLRTKVIYTMRFVVNLFVSLSDCFPRRKLGMTQFHPLYLMFMTRYFSPIRVNLVHVNLFVLLDVSL